MKTDLVKDLMIPISEYATVSEDANLYEAVLALEKAQEEFNSSHYTHRAILVYDKNQNIIGKVSQLDIIRALEPKYRDMQTRDGLARFGFTKKFMQSMLDQYKLWAAPLEDICRTASQVKVKQIMYAPSEGEYVDQNASLNEAIHMLIMGHHQSLLVIGDGEIVGILRLTDVFAAIFHIMKKCNDESCRNK